MYNRILFIRQASLLKRLCAAVLCLISRWHCASTKHSLGENHTRAVSGSDSDFIYTFVVHYTMKDCTAFISVTKFGVKKNRLNMERKHEIQDYHKERKLISSDCLLKIT